MTTVIQDPDAQLVYEMDWTNWLPATQIIDTSVWPSVTDLTFDNSVILSGGLKTGIRISGGVVGRTYQITNRIVTNGVPTQTGDNSFYIRIGQQ